jgi:hypothetical protein
LSDISRLSDVEVRQMAFREVSVVEVREVLRAWLAGTGLRTVAQRAGVDRKTARRYVAAAEAAGLVRTDGEAQLTDELIGQVVDAVRPGGHGRRGRRRRPSTPRSPSGSSGICRW